jgi:4-amino-4-deoxy-L-arabinose transferase-like glycosyltransferase
MTATLQAVERSAAGIADRPRVASTSLTLVLLGAILLLALGLRLWGLTWVPTRGLHPDEDIYASRAEFMVREGNPHPRYFQNPSLLTYLVAGQLLVARALGPLAAPLGPDPLSMAFRLARLDGALLGTAGVGLAFATGAALFGRRVGLLAALFLAVSFLHVRDSHYGVNDVPSAALLALSLYFDARLLRHPALRWYALAGLAGGLATSTKYNMGFFFVPLVAAHWLAPRAPGRRPYDVGALVALALAGAASLGGYLLGTPYTLLDFDRFSTDFLRQQAVGGRISWGQPLPLPLLHLTALLQGFGALPFSLALVGVVSAWRRRRGDAILVLAFPAVHLAFFLSKGIFLFPRLVIPLLPFCALLAGYGAANLAGRLPPRWRGIGLGALLAVALAQPLANSILHDRIMARTDTRVLAAEWVRTNLPTDDRLAVERGSLLLPVEEVLLSADVPRLRDQFPRLREGEQIADLAARGVEYVVINSFIYARDERWEHRRPLHQDLEQHAQLIALIGPGIGGREVPFQREDVVASPFWALEEYERPGPTIRIYSLAPLNGERR